MNTAVSAFTRLARPILSIMSFSHYTVTLMALDKQHSDGQSSSSRRDNHTSPKFGLPRMYDRSYRISFSVVPPDLAYKLRMAHDRRTEKRKERETLTMDHLTEFRTVLRHFVNFKQKQKVKR